MLKLFRGEKLMLNDFEKEVKKKLIDLEMTFGELALKSGFSSPWGLRQALKRNNEKTIKKVKAILSI